MATIGAAYPVFAPIIKEANSDKETVYGAGVIIGKMMNVSTAANFTVGSMLTNYKHRFEYAVVTLGTSEIPIVAGVAMFGYKQNGNTLSDPIMTGIPGAFGYIEKKVIRGQKKYVVRWIRRVVFTPPSESAVTKGESVSFTTPSIIGTAVREGKTWRDSSGFESLSEAKSYLKRKAGIVE